MRRANRLINRADKPSTGTIEPNLKLMLNPTESLLFDDPFR